MLLDEWVKCCIKVYLRLLMNATFFWKSKDTKVTCSRDVNKYQPLVDFEIDSANNILSLLI